jgi:hypothetical protein
MKWKEIESNKVRVFQLEDEPEVFYLIKIRGDEYMIVFDDGWGQKTGELKFITKNGLFDIYGIEV